MSARTLIWTPMPTAQLQAGLHEAGVGPAALVPVRTGTVLLPSPAAKLGQNILIADKARKLAGTSVLVYWNDTAAAECAFDSAIGRGWAWGEPDAVNRLGDEVKRGGRASMAFDRVLNTTTLKWRLQPKHQEAAVAHLVKVRPEADREQVAAQVAAWRTGGPAAVAGLLEALSLPEAAKVAVLAGEGRADLWLHQLPAPRTPGAWWKWAFLALLLVAAVGAALADVPPYLAGLIGAVLAVPAVVLFARTARRPVKGKPINTALPVIPVTQGSAPTD